MKILVTGHKGFIGSIIYSNLKGKYADVDGIDTGDSIPDRKYDYIIHLGARTLIRLSKDKPYEYFLDNLDLSMRILELARKHGSIVVYPTSGSESEATNPYSLAKKQVVEWIELYRNLYNLRRHVLKFYNIYGPTSRKGAVFLFSDAALRGEPITIYGDGTHVRDFIHVNDVSRCIDLILEGKVEEGHHEIGTGIGTSVNELIEIVERVTGTKLKAIHKEYVLPEGEALFAKKPLLKETISIEDGVREVVGELKKERSLPL